MADTESARWFPTWTPTTADRVAPEERLPWPQTLIAGFQHVVAMFGSTVLAPIIMGFDPNVSVLFSGLGTLIFFLVVGGRVPSYLGSSFSFIAVVIAATAYSGAGPNPNIATALGGIVAAGVLYLAIGLVVVRAGHRWIETLMPPVVTGGIVAAIGLNLAPIAVKGISASDFDRVIGLVTIVSVGVAAVYAPGVLRRIPVLIGGFVGYVAYAVGAGVFGQAKAIDFSGLAAAPWLGAPQFTTPVFSGSAIALIAPVAIILVAENLGHIKAIGAMTGRNLDGFVGRAFVGDGLATILSGFCGGTGVTTYAENMGVMAVTKIYSTLVFVVAGVIAVLLGFSPKFGAAILTIPGPVIGGLSVVIFGLITATAGRIWVEHKVDFSETKNLITTAAAVIAGAGDLTLRFGGFTLGGIGTATFGAILLYALLNRRPAEPVDPAAKISPLP
ncbi:pyrimidine utilization transport protein G [Siculibacillus lacustris]|uniref:Pyrimidine utilization transport protein G n=1 Tax=Siculibacillus lacustris TaxID=1549641 RepID=A0A4Q9VHD4_9HYPH|nr:solute carrier family 23 protein [Siculibacillus lacustris]TBW34520.1 pyrimidine utilization transport protein G [Siculibacillus lacustris]